MYILDYNEREKFLHVVPIVHLNVENIFAWDTPNAYVEHSSQWTKFCVYQYPA